MGGCSQEEIAAQLDRILGSALFRQAGRLTRFLRFVVEQTLHGAGNELKEYRIGLDVFDRPAAFDPRVDPIVRISASRLRNKLEQYYQSEGRRDGMRIEIPKGGYAAVFSHNVATAEAEVSGASAPTPRRIRWRMAALSLLALLALAAAFLWRWTGTVPRASGQHRIMLAVLPFANLSGDPQQEYLSDGLTEEVIARLGNLNPQQLGVIARTSVMGYKNTAKHIDEIARELRVDYVLEGSVRRAGSQARITAQLIQARDQTHMWAQNYDGDLGDLLTFESGIAEATAREISIQLQPGELARTGLPVKAEAREAYLKGRYLWNQRTDPAIRQSIGYFEQAITLEPGYAQAYSALADSYVVLVSDDTSARNQDNVVAARAAARKALQLDDSLGEPYAALAHVKFLYDWDFKTAEVHYQRALERSPNNATVRHWYGVLLLYQGRAAEAESQLKQAQALDPLSPVIGSAAALNYMFAGDLDRALTQARTVIAMNSGFSFAHDVLGGIYESQRQYPEALAEYQKYAELSGRDPDALSRLGHCYAVLGNTAEARRVLFELEHPRAGTFISPSNPALIYASLGEKERALDLLRAAVEERSSAMLALARDPGYESLRADPRFQDLVSRVGLPR
jgi:TolB-like protein/Flp pilus assembly protein TadD